MWYLFQNGLGEKAQPQFLPQIYKCEWSDLRDGQFHHQNTTPRVKSHTSSQTRFAASQCLDTRMNKSASIGTPSNGAQSLARYIYYILKPTLKIQYSCKYCQKEYTDKITRVQQHLDKCRMFHKAVSKEKKESLNSFLQPKPATPSQAPVHVPPGSETKHCYEIDSHQENGGISRTRRHSTSILYRKSCKRPHGKKVQLPQHQDRSEGVSNGSPQIYIYKTHTHRRHNGPSSFYLVHSKSRSFQYKDVLSELSKVGDDEVL